MMGWIGLKLKTEYLDETCYLYVIIMITMKHVIMMNLKKLYYNNLKDPPFINFHG